MGIIAMGAHSEMREREEKEKTSCDCYGTKSFHRERKICELCAPG